MLLRSAVHLAVPMNFPKGNQFRLLGTTGPVDTIPGRWQRCLRHTMQEHHRRRQQARPPEAIRERTSSTRAPRERGLFADRSCRQTIIRIPNRSIFSG